ncbi:membrane protein [Microbacterium phage Cece]|nr:membrane protein [Microbacterium phage Cece]
MAKPGIVPRVLEFVRNFPGLTILIGLLVIGGAVLLVMVPAWFYVFLIVLAIIGGALLLVRVIYEVVRHFD